MANLRLFRGPATGARCPDPQADSVASGEEQRVLIRNESVLTDHSTERILSPSCTRDGLPILDSPERRPVRACSEFRTGRRWGENHQPQAEKGSRRPTSNAHAIPQMIIHRACLVRGNLVLRCGGR